MKIICIGRNYVNHAKELGNAVPTSPVLFIKPETALNATPSFQYPDFSGDIHFELELVLKINKTGKNISLNKADSYYNQIGLGIDFTARDLQTELKTKGLPWEKAKAFDGSAVVSDFISINELENLDEINFELLKNGQSVQKGNSKDMLFNFSNIISYSSKYFTLEEGDLIFTGTPQGVGSIIKNDVLTGSLEGNRLLNVTII